ncbi:MAG: RAMP superfamily CRISPR-associated protein [Bacillota bacterium]
MQQLKVEITTKAPLVIKNSHNEANLISTLDYIPGSQLRGKLAGRLTDKEQFADLILSSQVRFNNLYPEGGKPIPLSAFSCKYYSGFRNEGVVDKADDGLQHGVYDKLLEKVLLANGAIDEDDTVKYCDKELGPEAGDDVLGLGNYNHEKEQECDSFLKGYSGFYKLKYEKGQPYYETVTVDKSKIERTAINAKTNAAEQGSLYILETIDAGQKFAGTIDVLNDDPQLIDKLKELINQQTTAYFGTGKSRGHGKVGIEVEEVDTAEQNLEQQQKFSELQQRVADNGQQANDKFFSLTLNSDTIVYNDFLQGKKQITIEDILRYADYLTDAEKEEINKFKAVEAAKDKKAEGDNQATSKVYFAWVNSVYGWNGLTNLPKVVEPALAKGSVFCYQTQSSVNENELLSALEKIEKWGLGERRNEGYGQVSINDRFHWDQLKEGK